jgi:hypothetical protein
MKTTQNSFIWRRCTRHIDVWEKIRRHTTKWRLFKRKQCAYFGFSKQRPLSKRNAVTELNMEKFHLQVTLPDVG